MSIEQQLREQLSQELQKHTVALSEAFQALRSFQKDVEKEQNEVMALEAKLHLFDQTFGTGTGPTVGVSPPPPPVVAAPPAPDPLPAPEVQQPPPEPPAPPVKRTITREYVKEKINNSRAAIGRREVAEGLRPKIRDAMVESMGDKTMNAIMIFNFLKSKDWLPNSKDPRAYIAYLLSSLRDTFERVEGRGRGFYRVRRASEVPVNNQHVNGAAGLAAADLSATDAILRDAGVLPAN